MHRQAGERKGGRQGGRERETETERERDRETERERERLHNPACPITTCLVSMLSYVLVQHTTPSVAHGNPQCVQIVLAMNRCSIFNQR